MKYIALIILAFFQVVLAIVLGYKKQSKVSKSFILLSVNMAMWAFANVAYDFTLHRSSLYTSNPGVGLQYLDWANKIGFFFGALTLLFIYRMILVFPIEQAKSLTTKIMTILGVVVAFLALTTYESGYFTLNVSTGVPQYHN